MRLDAMIILAVIFLLGVMIFYLPVFFVLKKKGKGGLRQLSYLLFLWSFLLILFVTLTPITFSPEQYHLNLRPFLWLEGGNVNRIELMESVGNVLMFIPLGFLLPAVFKKVRKIYLLAGVIFIITFSIEFIQYFMGRIADIDDVLENFLGGIIGYGIFTAFNKLLQSRRWWSRFIGMSSEGKMKEKN